MATTDIGLALQKLADLGFFDYVLPFLLIFALVFGILSTMRIFRDNKAIPGIIALAVGLMALQFGFVPQFFSEIFPRAGVALAVVLVFIILAGLFIDPERSWINYVLLGIGAFAALTTLYKSSTVLGWYSGYWVGDNLFGLIVLLVFIILVAIIIGSGKPKDGSNPYLPVWWRNPPK